MSKRLQVVVRDEDLETYDQIARLSGLTLSEWVRQTLRAAERQASLGDVNRKFDALRQATSLNLGPETDIGSMLAQIDAGHQQRLDD